MVYAELTVLTTASCLRPLLTGSTRPLPAGSDAEESGSARAARPEERRDRQPQRRAAGQQAQVRRARVQERRDGADRRAVRARHRRAQGNAATRSAARRPVANYAAGRRYAQRGRMRWRRRRLVM